MKTLLVFFIAGLAVLTASGQVAEKAEDISPLLIGETLPNVVLKSPDGSELRLLEELNQKPAVVLFYRGGWCPFCNTHLAEIQEAQSKIVELGYRIIAVSPDSPRNLQATGEQQHLAYSLYSDADGELIKAVGIAFRAPGTYTGMLSEKSDGLNPGILPVPAVFVVDTSGNIEFEYINPDYKARLSANLLLAVLKALDEDRKQ